MAAMRAPSSEATDSWSMRRTRRGGRAGGREGEVSGWVECDVLGSGWMYDMGGCQSDRLDQSETMTEGEAPKSREGTREGGREGRREGLPCPLM